jgi:hypothetical protein
MANERRLRCSHCNDGRGRRLEAVINVKDCSDAEWIGNNQGKLACEPRPQASLPQEPDSQEASVSPEEHKGEL